jgi:pimeloyl-ACP methyl ester carboxylesterase
MERISVLNGNVELSVQVAGEGPTVLLLHGWPDTGALWENVAPRLVEAGYQVVVPDLRGCGLSSKPADTSSYQMANLVRDVVCIMDAVGAERVTLVGHDWGAALAWAVATVLPERVDKLVVLSVGHPTAFRSAGIEQQVRSWYMLLFANDGLGEAFLRQNDYEALRRWTGHPRAQEVIAELERDGQMSAHLRWYRANVPMDSFFRDPPALPAVQAPTLGIWSSGDFALTERQMKDSEKFCANGFTYVRLEGFGHWIPLEAPGEVTREILNFLRPTPPSS